MCVCARDLGEHTHTLSSERLRKNRKHYQNWTKFKKYIQKRKQNNLKLINLIILCLIIEMKEREKVTDPLSIPFSLHTHTQARSPNIKPFFFRFTFYFFRFSIIWFDFILIKRNNNSCSLSLSLTHYMCVCVFLFALWIEYFHFKNFNLLKQYMYLCIVNILLRKDKIFL